jgi:hypothetical protein
MISARAHSILAVYARRGLRPGDLLHPTDFGEQIVWQGGFVRDDDAREALVELFDGGYLIEHLNAFELTEAGYKAVG